MHRWKITASGAARFGLFVASAAGAFAFWQVGTTSFRGSTAALPTASEWSVVVAPVGTDPDGGARAFRAKEIRIELGFEFESDPAELKAETGAQPQWLKAQYNEPTTALGCGTPANGPTLTISGEMFWDVDSYIPSMAEDGQTRIPDDVTPGVEVVLLRDGDVMLASWISSVETEVDEETLDALTVRTRPVVGILPSPPETDHYDVFRCVLPMPSELLTEHGTDRLILLPGIDGRASTVGVDPIESASLLSVRLPTDGRFDVPEMSDGLASTRLGNTFFWRTTSQRLPVLVTVGYRGDDQTHLTMQFLAGLLAGIAASIAVQVFWDRTSSVSKSGR